MSNGDSFCSINLNEFIKDVGKKLIKISLTKNTNYKSNETLNKLTIINNKIFYDSKSKLMNAGIYYLSNKY